MTDRATTAASWSSLALRGRVRAGTDGWSPTLRRLVWVIAGLALSVLPHVPHIKAWILLLAAGAAALRIVTEVKRWGLLARWLRTLLAVTALLAVLLDYRTLNGIDAGTALLVVMAGMKLLETRTVRDLTVVVFLAYFALFAAFLYNQSLLRLPYMLVTAWLLTVTLMRIHQTAPMSVREAVGIRHTRRHYHRLSSGWQDGFGMNSENGWRSVHSRPAVARLRSASAGSLTRRDR